MQTAAQSPLILPISFKDWDPEDLELYKRQYDIKPQNATLGDTFKKVTDGKTDKLITFDKDIMSSKLHQAGYKKILLTRVFIINTEILKEINGRLCVDYFTIDHNNKREFLHLLFQKK
jgi:hypothetical protein